MPSKKNAATPSSTPAKTTTTTKSTTFSSSSSYSSSSSTTNTSSSPKDASQILNHLTQTYLSRTPQRVKLLDAFLAFLVVVGALQFVYCVIAGNYPFNAFLAGFSATVGQFVLTASLRIQTNPENRSEFEGVSDERAFADYVFGSMILHFFCVNFIN